jgi:hypothetical protein
VLSPQSDRYFTPLFLSAATFFLTGDLRQLAKFMRGDLILPNDGTNEEKSHLRTARYLFEQLGRAGGDSSNVMRQRRILMECLHLTGF